MSFAIDYSSFYMIMGFLLATYSCVANDVIQTLGTFLSSNQKRPALVIWLFVSILLVGTLTYGWITNNGELSFGRLDTIPFTGTFEWYHVLPPFALLALTRFGMPVSTTFLLLMVFSPSIVTEQMIIKSALGYMLAFTSALFLYTVIAKKIEKKFLKAKDTPSLGWVIFQWFSTAFLWTQWIMQDVANIFVYLPRKFDLPSFILILTVFVSMLGLLCYIRGGKIQKIVSSKTNTKDIRSASIINLLYGFILIVFKEMSSIPMSTTWVFIGLLAGREIALHKQLKHRKFKKVWVRTGRDFYKIFTGLVVSVVVVYFIGLLR